MLVIGALIALYAIYIVIICFKNVFSKNSREKRYSRTISPYWGFCGMFGFLGFGGFWTYYKFGEIFPFAFFIFFGFFSFFFEGKLSHILEDELFQENKRKAQLEAYKIGFKLLFVVICVVGVADFLFFSCHSSRRFSITEYARNNSHSLVGHTEEQWQCLCCCHEEDTCSYNHHDLFLEILLITRNVLITNTK